MEDRKLEPIVDGKEVEKSKLEKALGLFLAEDISTISGSIKDDYIKPRLKSFGKSIVRIGKEFLVSSLIGCIEMLILGKTSRLDTNVEVKKTNYLRFYDSLPSPSSAYISSQTSATAQAEKDPTTGVKIIQIQNFGKAEEVREALREIIATYSSKTATVADYYQLVGIEPSKTDFSWGWTDLSKAQIVRCKDGWVIEFPRPKPVA